MDYNTQMEKKYLFVEILLIFVFIALPPVFAKSGLSLDGSFSVSILIEFLMAIALQVQHIKLTKTPLSKIEKFNSLIKSLKWGAICLGLLMITFAFVQVIAILLKTPQENDVVIKNPTTILSWAILIFTLITGSFFEEVLYRQFFPETLKLLFNKGHIFIEIFVIFLFAAAHRYLGTLSVLNAMICGTILRFCRTKTNTIYAVSIAHFTYNLTLIIFLIM